MVSKEAVSIFTKWKMKYDADMEVSNSKWKDREQLVFDFFAMLKAAKCSEEEALDFVSLVKKHIMPEESFFENSYKKRQSGGSPSKSSKKEYIDSLKKKISAFPNAAYMKYFPLTVDGVEIKAELPKVEVEQPEDDKWEIARFYEISAAMGVTPEEPWYYRYKDGTPKLTPDGLPRKTMGDHRKKKN
jgi:hypothetical protein